MNNRFKVGDFVKLNFFADDKRLGVIIDIDKDMITIKWFREYTFIGRYCSYVLQYSIEKLNYEF